VAQHEEVGHVHSELAGLADVLDRDVRLGAVSRDADRRDAEVVSSLEILDRADARQQQRREPSVLDDVGGGLEPLDVGVRAGTVGRLLPARPSPCATSIAATPAASSTPAISRTYSIEKLCETACMPSRSVTSWT